MRYGEGGYQPLHADAEKQSDDGDWVDNHCPWRSYVGLIYLTTAGQEHGGGDLHLPESDILLAPIRGLFVAFPASHEYVHEVTEVTWGARYGIATWTRND
jgi:predicted 2-oxoglutarate/Fe(II)-dependent dioxygenase YbiX